MNTRRRPIAYAQPKTLPCALAAFLSLVSVLTSCASSPKPWQPTDRLAQPSSASAFATPPDDSPAAMLGSSASSSPQVISWTDLRGSLAERAGAEVLEEVALDLILEDRCARQAIAITQVHIENEREQLLSVLSSESSLNRQDAERALTSIRARRGLGEHRFPALLKRNAMLRALVNTDDAFRDRIEPSPADIATARAIKHGQRIRAHLILVATLQDAHSAIERIASQGFEAVARAVSLDPSAPGGGLIAPVSLADPAQPAALRGTLGSLSQGSISQPFNVESGGRAMIAIVRHDGLIDATSPPDPVSDAQIASEIRRVRERSAMQSLAQRLIAESDIRVIDRHLGWSWDNRTPAP